MGGRMIAPPQCPKDERLMLQWCYAINDGQKIVEKKAWDERQDHRRDCPVCRARMEYFRKMMEK
jgi:hypothetical protein